MLFVLELSYNLIVVFFAEPSKLISNDPSLVVVKSPVMRSCALMKEKTKFVLLRTFIFELFNGNPHCLGSCACAR